MAYNDPLPDLIRLSNTNETSFIFNYYFDQYASLYYILYFIIFVRNHNDKTK